MTEIKKTLKVLPDIRKNKLHLTISGNITKKDLDALYTDTRFSVADLQPGFNVIADLSGCSLIHLNGIATFRKAVNYIIGNGAGNIVWVATPESLFYRQVMNAAQVISGYKPIYAATEEEAEEKLAKMVKRNGLRLHLHEFPVAYRVNDRSGQCVLIDISTSGCSVKSATQLPSVNEEILLIFNFQLQDIQPNIFKIKAKVVRIESDNFAAVFIDLDKDTQEQLWKCLIAELQRDL